MSMKKAKPVIFMAVLLVGCQYASHDLDADGLADPGVAQSEATPPAYESRFADLGEVTLHYLDWGGMDDPLLFLAGGGATAYDIGGLAQRFAASHRVLALTRRGTGESDHPSQGYRIDDHVADIVAFLDEVGLEQVTLVGHSMAGAEMTRLAELYPDRVRRLVYLDATFDYAGYAEMIAANPHPIASPADCGIARPGSWSEFALHCFGFVSDWMVLDHEVTTAHPTHPDLTPVFIGDATAHPSNYAALAVPSLAFVALADLADFAPGQAQQASQEVRVELQEYFREVRLPWSRLGADRFEREAAGSRVIRLEAHHLFFVPLEDFVVEEIRAFLASTP